MYRATKLRRRDIIDAESWYTLIFGGLNLLISRWERTGGSFDLLGAGEKHWNAFMALMAPIHTRGGPQRALGRPSPFVVENKEHPAENTGL